jgi:hypothetical protein
MTESATLDQAPEARSQTTDPTRWIALYVLCVGMLMIVLDATIAFVIGAGLVVAAIAIALTVPRGEPRAGAEAEADDVAHLEPMKPAYSEAA